MKIKIGYSRSSPQPYSDRNLSGTEEVEFVIYATTFSMAEYATGHACVSTKELENCTNIIDKELLFTKKEKEARDALISFLSITLREKVEIEE